MEGNDVMVSYRSSSYCVLLSRSEILCLRYHEMYLYDH
jgi:hypothetical protein